LSRGKRNEKLAEPAAELRNGIVCLAAVDPIMDSFSFRALLFID
jgi:hypothetical protein